MNLGNPVTILVEHLTASEVTLLSCDHDWVPLPFYIFVTAMGNPTLPMLEQKMGKPEKEILFCLSNMNRSLKSPKLCSSFYKHLERRLSGLVPSSVSISSHRISISLSLPH